MKLATGVAALSLAAIANAATYTVTVGIREADGQQGLGFDPSTIFPHAGDTIQFTFQLPDHVKDGTNVQHTVTQSTFEAPCTPKEGGFDAGLKTTTMTAGKSFTLLINDTQPLWFYSYANDDCNAPMVFAVNPPDTGQTAVLFRDAAETVTINHPAPPSPPSSEASSTSAGSGSGPTGGSGNGGSGEGTASAGINIVLAFSAFLLALM